MTCCGLVRTSPGSTVSHTEDGWPGGGDSPHLRWQGVLSLVAALEPTAGCLARGQDDVVTILHRISWALGNPDANK